MKTPPSLCSRNFPPTLAAATLLLLCFCLEIYVSAAAAAATDAEILQLDARQADMVRQGLLRRLGMKKVPSFKGDRLPVPDYFWQLYKENAASTDFVRHHYPITEKSNDAATTTTLTFELADESPQEFLHEANLRIRLRRRRRDVRDIQVEIFDAEGEEPGTSGTSHSLSMNDEEDEKAVTLDVSDILARRRRTATDRRFRVGLRFAPADAELVESGLIVHSDGAAPAEDEDGGKRRRRRRSVRKRNEGLASEELDVENAHLCRRRSLYVEFAQLNWDDWIVAPAYYEAHQCAGVCPNPLPSSLNASNHAIVQNLLHELDATIPAAVCIPTELSALSILYYDDQHRIVIKQYPDMVVEACGCR